MTSSNRADPCPSPLESNDLSDGRAVHLSGGMDMLTAPYRWQVQIFIVIAVAGVVFLVQLLRRRAAGHE
jgi:hypothetical protein